MLLCRYSLLSGRWPRSALTHSVEQITKFTTSRLRMVYGCCRFPVQVHVLLPIILAAQLCLTRPSNFEGADEAAHKLTIICHMDCKCCT